MKQSYIIYASDGYIANALRMREELIEQTLAPVQILSPKRSGAPPCESERPWLKYSTAWFEMIKATFLDRIVILDADLLIIGDISDLLSPDIDTPIAMVRDHFDVWQTGVVVLNPKIIPPDMYSDLVRMIPEQSWPKGDQSIINEYLKRNPKVQVMEIPKEYSWCNPDQQPTEDTKIVHFHGVPKPWEPAYNRNQHPHYSNLWFER